MGTRLAWVMGVLLAAGCGARPCEAVAKAFCADGAIDCEVARATFAAAELPDAACAEALEVLRMAEKRPADIRGLLKVTVLQELMKQSPRLGPAQIEALSVQARAIAERNAAGSEVQRYMVAPAGEPLPEPRFTGYLEVPDAAGTNAGAPPPPPTKQP